MKLRRNGPRAWQATTNYVAGADGIQYRGIHTSGRLLYVLWWHPRIIRAMRRGGWK